jgi:uncharacterized protein
VDRRLLDLLCCPVSRSPLGLLGPGDREKLNRAILTGGVKTVDGVAVLAALQAALLSADRKVVYRIVEDIPVLLPEEGIGTTQIVDWSL